MCIDCEIDLGAEARLDSEPSDRLIQEIEIDEFQLTDSKTRVILKMTLLEYILLEGKNPFFELNPDQPTCCY